MENLFKNAKFGDKFVIRNWKDTYAIFSHFTENGTSAICLCNFLKEYPSFYSFDLDGQYNHGCQSDRDIIGCYQSSEEEIFEKADFYSRVFANQIEMQDKVQNFIEGFETGYKKALGL